VSTVLYSIILYCNVMYSTVVYCYSLSPFLDYFGTNPLCTASDSLTVLYCCSPLSLGTYRLTHLYCCSPSSVCSGP